MEEGSVDDDARPECNQIGSSQGSGYLRSSTKADMYKPTEYHDAQRNKYADNLKKLQGVFVVFSTNEV